MSSNWVTKSYRAAVDLNKHTMIKAGEFVFNNNLGRGLGAAAGVGVAAGLMTKAADMTVDQAKHTLSTYEAARSAGLDRVEAGAGATVSGFETLACAIGVGVTAAFIPAAIQAGIERASEAAEENKLIKQLLAAG